MRTEFDRLVEPFSDEVVAQLKAVYQDCVTANTRIKTGLEKTE